MILGLTITDIILIAITIGFIASGYRRGFVMSMALVLGAVGGFAVAHSYSSSLGKAIAVVMPKYQGLAQLIAFFILFLVVARVLTYLLVWLARLLKIVTSLPLIAWLNRVLGGILGFVESVIVIGSTIYILVTLNLHPAIVTAIATSKVAGWDRYLFQYLLRYL